MKFRIRKLHAVIAGINAASIAGALVLTGIGGVSARSQHYNNAAERWDSEGGSTQVSCFFSDDAGMNKDGVMSLRSALTKSLEDVSMISEDGRSLFTDAYSTPGGSGRAVGANKAQSETEITIVGGDFFFFHDLRLLSGCYFSDSDIMQDGVVIDRELAWKLYSSDNVAGQEIYINDTRFFISGVVDTPSTKAEKECISDTPKVYISYGGAGYLGLASGEDPLKEEGSGESEFNKVTVYECAAPDPVENYVYNSLKESVESYGDGKAEIIDNTHRFKPSVLAKKFRKRWKYAVRDSKVIYPWWENASRITEYKLSPLYFFRRLLYAPPVLTVLWILYLVWRFISRNKVAFISAVVDKIYQIRYKRHLKKQQKEAEKTVIDPAAK